MKRNMIVAAVAAVAVIGGGAVAGAALTGGNERGSHADELTASITGGDGGAPSNSQPLGGSDDPDDRDDTSNGDDGANGDDRGDTSGSGPGRSGGSDDAAGSGAGGWIGVVGKVERTALAAAPGYVVDIERDDTDDTDDTDGRHWEVDVAGDDGRWHELKISLDGTEVLEHERDDDDDDVREKRRLLSNASVPAGEAARIAEEYSGASVKELELEKDEKAWDLELRDPNGSEWELKVHVESGEVFDVERDG
ncbi:hypothetical protein GCM10027160_39760 [Streptomyces calidiresistens]|uniref:PepSY domain-containing protein n=1 Tax=Streptomyces calidiresistens TaxID=1485586 RepID=A0A7W3T1G1_9ACTN|nr:PepSY domain-containing protein [Streptomyces calidiresistens]MBB0229199.1 hypothetical protein [Streptomyces calidiresistens]